MSFKISIILLISIVFGQTTTFQVIDHNSDRHFLLITPQNIILTDVANNFVSKRNVTLSCNVVILKSVKLLLQGEDCASTLAKCDDNNVHMYNPRNVGKNDISSYRSIFTFKTSKKFFSEINEIGSKFCYDSSDSYPTGKYTQLQHPMEVFSPGIFLNLLFFYCNNNNNENIYFKFCQKYNETFGRLYSTFHR